MHKQHAQGYMNSHSSVKTMPNKVDTWVSYIHKSDAFSISYQLLQNMEKGRIKKKHGKFSKEHIKPGFYCGFCLQIHLLYLS